jgi:hypothetical protein
MLANPAANCSVKIKGDSDEDGGNDDADQPVNDLRPFHDQSCSCLAPAPNR